MISAQPVKTLTEILENILEAPVEVFGDLHVVNKQRELAIKTGNSTLCFKIDYEITFQNIHQQGKMLNKAELLLLPEELPVFSSALISQSVSLPTNYPPITHNGWLWKRMSFAYTWSPKNFLNFLPNVLQPH